MPSRPDQIKEWLTRHIDPSSATSVGGYGIVAHMISQSAVRGMSQAWKDRRALDCVSRLLIAGVRVDVPSPLPGPHPLFESCYHKMPRTVCLLLDHGADALNTRHGTHDDLYVIDQALQSFDGAEQRKSFQVVMTRLLSPTVVDRINRETDSDGFFRQMMGYGSPSQIKRRISLCIGQGVRVQDQWKDAMTSACVSMDWARQEEAGVSHAAMNGKTDRPALGSAPIKFRF